MKHKLLDWEEYQRLRSNLAKYKNALITKYKNTLINNEPEKDLTNDEINYINLNILNDMAIQTSKDSSNMFYRRINLVVKPIDSTFSELYLLDPSTMPKKNIIDSILSWLENGKIYCGDKYVASSIIGLSKEDIEQYKTILDIDKPILYELIPELKYGVDYTRDLKEM